MDAIRQGSPCKIAQSKSGRGRVYGESSLRGQLGQELSIFFIPVDEKAGAAFRQPSATHRVFKRVALAIYGPRAPIQDCEKAKPAAA